MIDERGGFRCDVVPEAKAAKIPNESARPGCYLNTATGRWECADVPDLDQQRAPKAVDHHRDRRFRQSWASVSNIPVPTSSVSVGKRKGTSAVLDIIAKIIPTRRNLNPLALGKRRIRRSRKSNVGPYAGRALAAARTRDPEDARISTFTAEVLCCYDVNTSRIVCPSDRALHGLRGTVIQLLDTNTSMPKALIETRKGPYTLPLCPYGEGRPGDGIPTDCCYDGAKGVLICPTSEDLDGTSVTVVTTFTYPDGRKGASVSGDGVDIRVPVCRLPPEIRPPANCCVDKATMQIVCPDTLHPWHGVDVSINASCYVDKSGDEVCFIDLGGDANVTLMLCTQPPGEKVPPPTRKPPRDCCFNVATMAIICKDETDPFHGVVVPDAAVSIGTDAEGAPYADISVSGDQRVQMPVCDRPDIVPPPPGDREPPDVRVPPPPGDREPPGDLIPPPPGREPPDVRVPPPPRTPPRTPPGTPPPPGVSVPPQCTPARLCGDPNCPTCNLSTPPTGVPLEKPCCSGCAKGLACEGTCPAK